MLKTEALGEESDPDVRAARAKRQAHDTQQDVGTVERGLA
jgi:hypothetical protein